MTREEENKIEEALDQAFSVYKKKIFEVHRKRRELTDDDIKVVDSAVREFYKVVHERNIALGITKKA